MSHTFHNGQIAVQKITGEEKIAKTKLCLIKDSIHPNSIAFIEKQILVFVGSEDAEKNLWGSVLIGGTGFVNVSSVHEIAFNLSENLRNSKDILFKNIQTNPTVGLLFHDAKKRARYKVWGFAKKKENQLCIKVNQGHPNCPKHMQKELITLPSISEKLIEKHTKGTSLEELDREWIANAHTFFIITQTKKGSIEVSHRGGNPGFIEVLKNGVLRVPDYSGDSIFSTLGNIYENPKAALLFVDYNKGKTLQLSGKAELQFHQTSMSDLQKSGKTARFFTFETTKWIKTQNHHHVNSNFINYSPFNIS